MDGEKAVLRVGYINPKELVFKFTDKAQIYFLERALPNFSSKNNYHSFLHNLLISKSLNKINLCCIFMNKLLLKGNTSGSKRHLLCAKVHK